MKTSKALLPFLVLLAGGALSGCRSNDASDVPTQTPEDSGPTCICGTPEAAIHACVHPACMDGQANPNNPDCACGSLSIDD